MSLRVRIWLFLVTLVADEVFVRTQPWTVIIACLAYLVFVMPAISGRRHD